MRKSTVCLCWLACCMSIMLVFAGCAKDEVDTTGAIYGIVNDADSGEPVSGVHVVLNPGGKTTNTGSDGRYEFQDMEPGQYTIQISKNGYKTNTKRISVVAGEEASGDMMLERGEARIKLSTGSLSFAKGGDVQDFRCDECRYFRFGFMERHVLGAVAEGYSPKGKHRAGEKQHGSGQHRP